jgi:hypothetical protein
MPRLGSTLLLLILAAPAWAEPPDDGKCRTDRYGDPLPEGAIARLGTLRHRYPMSNLRHPQLLPDGKTFLSSTKTEVCWTDAATGKRVKSWRLPDQWHVAGFSPDWYSIPPSTPVILSNICLRGPSSRLKIATDPES